MANMERAHALRLLTRRLAARAPLDHAETTAMLSLPAIVLPVRAGTDFITAGEPVEHSCLIAAGLCARVEQLVDGRRQIISLHVPGDLVDIHSLLLPGAPATLEAIAHSTLVKIPHKALRDLVARCPGLATALWRETAADGIMTAQAVARLGRRDAYARIAHLFCEMAMRYGHIGEVRKAAYHFPMTQEQLGDALGLTSVHINRMLRALREDGLVATASSRVEILNWPGLREAAQFDPTYLGLPDLALSTGLVA